MLARMKLIEKPVEDEEMCIRDSNIRDHRHVTSLLHRIETTQYGIEVTPVLSFCLIYTSITTMIPVLMAWTAYRWAIMC